MNLITPNLYLNQYTNGIVLYFMVFYYENR